MKRTLILGGPGAGKTYELLSIMERALESGVAPDAIALVSFTNAAVNEAKERAMKKFGLNEKDLPYFRTSHSLAFRELGMSRADVLGEEHLTELSDATGEMVTSINLDNDGGPAMRRNADELLTIDHLARTTQVGLEEALYRHGGEINWFRLSRFASAYRAYKTERHLFDFTDMLEAYLNTDLPPVPVKIAIIDEGQDFTTLQWKVVEKAFRNVQELYVAGDDMQQIHAWAGAAEDYFLNLDMERRILPLSHRLPNEIFNFAENLASRVSHRYEKVWKSSGRSGKIEWVTDSSEVDLSKGTWLLLARTRAQLAELAETARGQGVVYTVKGQPSVRHAHVVAIKAYEALRAGKRVEAAEVQEALKAAGVKRELVDEATYTAKELNLDVGPIWHDALIRIPLADREYYLTCLRRKERLDGTPRVRVETIHGAKGAEAENTILNTDLTYRTHRGYEFDPDAEHRVFYVGITRASSALYLVSPKTPYGFPL